MTIPQQQGVIAFLNPLVSTAFDGLAHPADPGIRDALVGWRAAKGLVRTPHGRGQVGGCPLS